MAGEMVTFNPWAPPALLGIGPLVDAPPGCRHEPVCYTFEPFTLLASETVTKVIQLDRDGDFLLLALSRAILDRVHIVNFTDDQGNWIVKGLDVGFFNRNVDPDMDWPFPIFPGILYPAGSQIRVRIVNTEALDSSALRCQWFFWGMRRVPR